MALISFGRGDVKTGDEDCGGAFSLLVDWVELWLELEVVWCSGCGGVEYGWEDGILDGV